jgi:hypothetical protein
MYETAEAPYPRSNSGLGSSPPTEAQETLASITPRVLVRARQVADRSDAITGSLGLIPTVAGANAEKQPSLTLMGALREMEQALDFTLGRLDSIHQHING